ncbi:HNH endonuclease [Hymenobacter cavernae]|uniref:HNH endonuclease n=1 Tax=Hymenobacter cavernae TaxID=2044852 RepID=UPI0016631787|nr:HNH endonuclease [Hymenobacter cavernae]
MNDVKSYSVTGGIALVEQQIAETYLPALIKRGLYGFEENKPRASKYNSRFVTGDYKRKLLERDENKCMICKANPKKNKHVYLQMHHIIRWTDKGISNPENIITLCKICHDKVHRSKAPLEEINRLHKINKNTYNFSEYEMTIKLHTQDHFTDEDIDRMMFINNIKSNCICIQEHGKTKFFHNINLN